MSSTVCQNKHATSTSLPKRFVFDCEQLKESSLLSEFFRVFTLDICFPPSVKSDRGLSYFHASVSAEALEEADAAALGVIVVVVLQEPVDSRAHAIGREGGQ